MKDLKQIEPYTSYPKYKDSGIEWLGKIPDHWEKVKTKTIFKLVNGGTPKSDNEDFWDEEGIVWITPEDLSSHGIEIDNSKRKISKEGLLNSSATLTKENSIVISTRAPIGNIKICTVPYTTNQGCKSLESISNLNIRYFYYLFYCSKDYLQSLGKGTTFLEVSNYSLKNMELIVPPIDEQNQIARFLDKKTSEIDSLIADKEKLIEHLQEYRQAIITEAVTKGLSPETTKMKDSGIEWLGEVPEHWEIKRLGFLCRINPSKSEVSGIDGNEEVSFLPMDRIGENGEILLDLTKSIKEVYHGFTYFRDEDVLVAKITPCFENGKGALCRNLTNGIGFGTTELHVLRPGSKINPDFLYYLTSSTWFRKLGEGMMTGAAGQKRVPEDFIKNFKIALPPLHEQETIVEFIKNKIIFIEHLVLDIQTEIKKLREYRESLICEAVTGKIDVRGFRKGE